MTLEEKKEFYIHDLTMKQTVLEAKTVELDKEKTSILQYISEKNQIDTEEQAINEQVAELDTQINNSQKNVEEWTNSMASLQKELGGIFLFAFARKKELKGKIEDLESKIELEKIKIEQLVSDKSDLMKKKKSELLEEIKERIVEQQNRVVLLEKDIADLENEICKLNSELHVVESAIEELKQNEEKQASKTLYSAILSFRKQQECWEFFSELIGPNEYLKLEHRAQVAKLLDCGATYSEINKENGASTATISRMNQVLQQDDKFCAVVMKNRDKQSASPREYFAGLIMQLENEQECKEFFACLCSPSERRAIEMRMNIASRLMEGKTYVQVSDETGASSATIGRVKNIIDKEGSIIRSFFEKAQEPTDSIEPFIEVKLESSEEVEGLEISKEVKVLESVEVQNVEHEQIEEKDVKEQFNEEMEDDVISGLITEDMAETLDVSDQFEKTGGSVQELVEEVEIQENSICITSDEAPAPVVCLEESSTCDEPSEDTPYYEIYGFNPMDYAGIRIESLGFSVRLENRVKVYKTLEKLLEVHDKELRAIKGFGKACFDELHAFFSTLTLKKDTYINAHKDVKFRLPKELLPYREQLLYGDFSFLEELTVSDASLVLIEKIKEIHEILDFEFVENLADGAPEINGIIEMLCEFGKRFEHRKYVENIMKKIPAHRLDTSIDLIVKFFTDNENELNYLRGFFSGENQSLREYLYANADRIWKNDPCIKRLVEWCQYDLDLEINAFFIGKIKNDRELQVISSRANRKTLEEIGKTIEVTRERVRQIEAKVKLRFSKWQKQERVMFKIFLEMGESTGLSTMEIINAIGSYGKEFIYLMKICATEEIKYDGQLDMFVIEDLSLTEKIQAYVESMPDTFSEKKLTGFLQVAVEENDYPEKMVRAVIEESYRKTGDTYHRFKLTLTAIYSDVMKKYYPNGIHVYNPDEIDGFRKHVMDDYSIDITDKTDHAIGSILSRIGILCGRGIYKLQSEKTYMSKTLASRIHDYIEESKAPIFMTNTLFSIFEDELVAEGIDNKYFLQGALRELYEDKWIFRRDYISKDEAYTSMYSSIVGFIKNASYPVSRDDLIRAFPGVTEIVIHISVRDPNVLNLFGLYIHSSHLKLSNNDIKYLKDTVEHFLAMKEVCHCSAIYDYINADYPILLTNNFVHYPFSLYSLLEYLFRDSYNFSRPYVAKENAIIERVQDVLMDIIKESERMEISEIQAFAREHCLFINNIREFIDSCNDTHLLISELEVASIEYIGITEQIAKEIESWIIDEIDTTVPIHQLKCIHALPNINVEWNTWLIYSVLNKWSTMLEVGTSASQFRQSYPMVAPKGKLDSKILTEIDSNHEGKIVVADDLKEIDDLVSDFILEDLGDFDGL